MKTGLFSKAIDNIVEARAEKKSDGFAMVNVRPGEKVSAMLDVIAWLYQKTPSVVIADALSQKIAEHAASSKGYADAIADTAMQVAKESGALHPQSALGILQAHGVLEVKNPLMRSLDELGIALPAAGNKKSSGN